MVADRRSCFCTGDFSFFGNTVIIPQNRKKSRISREIANYDAANTATADICPQWRLAYLKIGFAIPFSFLETFGAGSSGGNFLVPARKLIRSRLKGRCRKAAPLRIPRPLRRKYPGMFRVAMGSSVGGTRIKNKSFRVYLKTGNMTNGEGFSA